MFTAAAVRSLIVATCLGAAASSAVAQTVVSGHPRLYVRPGDVAGLRARVTQAPISTFYNLMRTRMTGATQRSANDENSGFELESLALLHLIEGGSTYRNKIMNSWRLRSYAPGQISHWALPFQVMSHAIALDYLWNEITPSERAELAAVVVALMDDLYNYAPYNLPGSGANQMSDYSNQLYYHLGSLAFAGVVLSGEGLNDTRAAFYLSEADSLIRTRMIPAMNQEAGGDAELNALAGFTGNGGWGEDMAHTDMTHPMFGRMIEAWRTGTGQDWFPNINGLATFARYVTYMMRPNGGLVPKGNHGSYQLRPDDRGYGTIGCLISARYGDPLGNFLKQASYTGAVYGFHQMGAVLWCNPALPPANFAAMPRTMYFRGQGEVVARTGFTPTDTWVYVRSGPIYNGHQHDDQGNLLVDAYGGELLIENAGEAYQETRFHNTIRVAGREQIPYGNNAVQRARPLAGTPYERGRVTDVQAQNTYTYVATDFGNAYDDATVPAPKAGKVTREVVTILPDIIVVRDRVTVPGTHQVDFHSWPSAGQLNAGAKEWSLTHGSGRGWLKTVLPASATQQVSSDGVTDVLTVSAPLAGAAADFVHVLYLSPAGAVTTPTQVTAIDTAADTGVSLRDREGRVWSITFNKAGVGLRAVTGGGTTVLPQAPRNLRIVLPPGGPN